MTGGMAHLNRGFLPDHIHQRDSLTPLDNAPI